MGTTRWIPLSLLLVILAAGSLATAQKRADQLRDGIALQQKYAFTLTGLNGKPLLQPKAGNCEVNAFALKEQGFRFDGGLGGIGFVDDGPPSVRPHPLPQPQSERYADLAAAYLGHADGSDVAIMIVDAFGAHPDAKLGGAVFDLSTADLAGYGTDPFAALDHELATLEATGEASHGALVYAYALALVSHLPPKTTFEGFVDPAADGAEILRQAVFEHLDAAGRAHRIVVQAVDTHGYDTARIVDAIQNALHEDAGHLGIDRVALNMSFGIVPCSVEQDYEASKASGTVTNIDEYLKALELAGFGGTLEQLRRVLFTPFPEDPLQIYLRDYARTSKQYQGTPQRLPGRLVALASSGNDGLGFPYAPAAWPRVVAVGANEALTSDRADFSNTAGVRTGGAWYRVEDPVLAGGPRVAAHAAVAGTSFASPGAAVFTALDLMLTDPACDLPGTMYALSDDLADQPLDVAVSRCLLGPH